MSDFSTILKAKIEEKGLSLVAATTAIGVSGVSLRSALSGASFPNSRSVGKYAAFIGLGETEVTALIEASKPTTGTKVKKEKPIKVPKEPKPPKPPKPPKEPKLPKAPKPPKAPKAPKLPKTPNAVAAGTAETPRKRGRKPGSKHAAQAGNKPGRSVSNTNATAALATIAAALQQAENLASDSLALAVHHLSQTQRNVIDSLLKTFA